ncbi:MAG TPA: MobA/MobL family protein [Magnetospirillum sp.]|jgi:hypothetical protein|nr:MobA/MobL family protein [Magnetospirillum sp.]
MAFFRVELGLVRRSDGGNACRRSAYQACERANGFDFSHKAPEHVGGFQMVPDGAGAWAKDRCQVAAAMEVAEKRADAQIARTIDFAIPAEIPEDQATEFVRAVLEPYRQQGMLMQVDLHREPALTSDGINLHAAVLVSMRRSEADGFSKTKPREWNDLFADFAAGKVRRDRAAVRGARADIATRMNAWFADNGIAAHVDARTYAEQGLDIPAAPVVPKRFWRQWERLRAKDPDAPPPQPIAEYLAWRGARDAALADLAIAEKDFAHARTEPAPATQPVRPDAWPEGDARSDQDSGQQGRPDPGTSGAGRRPQPDSGDARGDPCRDGRAAPGGDDATTAPRHRPWAASAELGRLTAAVNRYDDQMQYLLNQARRLNPQKRAALDRTVAADLRRQADALERQAHRQIDIEAIISSRLPDFSGRRQQW